jgi:hypothetical protein
MNMLKPEAHRVFPEELKTKDPDTERQKYDTANSLDDQVIRNVKQFAYAQACVDEARIACRLERFRLAHGSYPPSLDVLTPAYGSSLPRDVMNGEDYHYKIMPDASYRLYSVGWNLIDDGGRWDYGNNVEDPDWVWTTYRQSHKNR